MKKIDFYKDVLPHAVAVLVFLVVTVLFFNPYFFDNKTLDQQDIHQFSGSSKSIADYRAATGEEALWAPSMFSGMPAYLVSLRWSDGALEAREEEGAECSHLPARRPGGQAPPTGFALTLQWMQPTRMTEAPDRTTGQIPTWEE